jgi:hypothetical protein
MLSPFAAIKRRDREPNLNGGLASGTSRSAWRGNPALHHERREGRPRMRRVDSAEVTMIRTWRAHGLRGARLREGAYAEGRTSSFLP